MMNPGTRRAAGHVSRLSRHWGIGDALPHEFRRPGSLLSQARPHLLPHARASRLREAPRRTFSRAQEPASAARSHHHGRENNSQEDKTSRSSSPRTRVSKLLVATAITVVAATTTGILLTLMPIDAQPEWFQTWRAHRLFGTALNEHTFVPFAVTSVEPVSPTAFILTVRPKVRREGAEMQLSRRGDDGVGEAVTARHGARAAYERAWRHGTWSVEAKQPLLQIARDYTPLPPRLYDGARGEEGERAHLEDGELRFLIRRLEGGEVSGFLSRRRVGDTVELRGPHLGFDVHRRLGLDDDAAAVTAAAAGEGAVGQGQGQVQAQPRKVVFLAAGTGIAPALQVARAAAGLPGARGAEVQILWANRRREDCVGCDVLDRPGTAAQNSDATTGLDDKRQGAVVRQLAQMKQRRGGDGLRVRCVVDEERTFIDEASIRTCLESAGGTMATRQTAARRSASPSPTPTAGRCQYHSEAALERLSADPVATSTTMMDAPCPCGAGGRRNLLFVSGPDGFIDAIAGRKRWEGGEERQGPVGGLLGSMKSAYPDLLKDWLMIKL